MGEKKYTYIIVGAGLAGVSAIEGIRERDKDRPILLIGNEGLPYDRPPLSKKLWLGKKKIEEIFLHDEKFYSDNKVTLLLGTKITEVDPEHKTVSDEKGNKYSYDKLLLSTGGAPRMLPVVGGYMEEICYYRYYSDYLKIRKQAEPGKSAVIIGGGFIGSEMAAALNFNKLDVTMIFPENYMCSRVFPESLGRTMMGRFLEKGVRIIKGDKPVSFTRNGDKLITQTDNGKKIESDMVIAGVGIAPEIKLAEMAKLSVGNGIVVNEQLNTSSPDIYSAGDNTLFYYQVLGKQMRLEHWDNSINQGKLAGRNMTGDKQLFRYMPYFFSDLFEFGYEAVGEVTTELEIFCDWQKENDTGVIYYLKDNKIRGIMMCNIWDKVDTARQLIIKDETVTGDKLHGLIK
jgi:3-phenylpropionate/trans-cinnamate dioxygenase ferredoxin reductase component